MSNNVKSLVKAKAQANEEKQIPANILNNADLGKAIEAIASIVESAKGNIKDIKSTVDVMQMQIFASCVWRIRDNSDFRPLYGVIRNAKFMPLAKKLIVEMFPNIAFTTIKRDGKNHIVHGIIDGSNAIAWNENLYADMIDGNSAGYGISSLKDYIGKPPVKTDSEKYVKSLRESLLKVLTDKKLSDEKMHEVLSEFMTTLNISSESNNEVVSVA